MHPTREAADGIAVPPGVARARLHDVGAGGPVGVAAGAGSGATSMPVAAAASARDLSSLHLPATTDHPPPRGASTHLAPGSEPPAGAPTGGLSSPYAPLGQGARTRTQAAARSGAGSLHGGFVVRRHSPYAAFSDLHPRESKGPSSDAAAAAAAAVAVAVSAGRASEGRREVGASTRGASFHPGAPTAGKQLGKLGAPSTFDAYTSGLFVPPAVVAAGSKYGSLQDLPLGTTAAVPGAAAACHTAPGTGFNRAAATTAAGGSASSFNEEYQRVLDKISDDIILRWVWVTDCRWSCAGVVVVVVVVVVVCFAAGTAIPAPAELVCMVHTLSAKSPA